MGRLELSWDMGLCWFWRSGRAGSGFLGPIDGSATHQPLAEVTLCPHPCCYLKLLLSWLPSGEAAISDYCTENISLSSVGEKPHKCELCDFTCRDVSYLSKHMLTHSNDKNFMCTECGYITKWKHYLNVHMRKHTGDLRYYS